VVEDEPSVRDSVVDVLHERGYATLEASDGLTGLAMDVFTTRVSDILDDGDGE
jgi:DNA-binding response OmpR family regulator